MFKAKGRCTFPWWRKPRKPDCAAFLPEKSFSIFSINMSTVPSNIGRFICSRPLPPELFIFYFLGSPDMCNSIQVWGYRKQPLRFYQRKRSIFILHCVRSGDDGYWERTSGCLQVYRVVERTTCLPVRFSRLMITGPARFIVSGGTDSGWMVTNARTRVRPSSIPSKYPWSEGGSSLR